MGREPDIKTKFSNADQYARLGCSWMTANAGYEVVTVACIEVMDARAGEDMVNVLAPALSEAIVVPG